MSITPAATNRLETAVAPRRRVRHQARETAAVMLFSAVVSVGLAAAFVLLAGLGG